jgi:hypothetical protein
MSNSEAVATPTALSSRTTPILEENTEPKKEWLAIKGYYDFREESLWWSVGSSRRGERETRKSVLQADNSSCTPARAPRLRSSARGGQSLRRRNNERLSARSSSSLQRNWIVHRGCFSQLLVLSPNGSTYKESLLEFGLLEKPLLGDSRSKRG